MSQKNEISYLVVLGDSLSDGGQLKHTNPLLASATNLADSPKGRFTDGYTWADDLARSASLDIIKEQFIAYIVNAIDPNKLIKPDVEIEEFKTYIRAIDLEKFHPDTFDFEKLKASYVKQHANNIFDAIDYNKFDIANLNENIKNFLYGSFSLGDYQNVLFQGRNFVRRFAEGGSSAYQYSAFPEARAFSLILEKIKNTIGESRLSLEYLTGFVSQFVVLVGEVIGARAMLSNLDAKTEALLNDDKLQKTSLEQKEKTLVTEWTGANDFITMNAFSSKEVCDDAIQARMTNIEKLAAAGYKNFLLVDLPDLGKTPKYINSPEKEKVTELVQYFNQTLSRKIQEMQEKKPELNIKLFNLSQKFDAIYKNPESFGLPKEIDKTHASLGIPSEKRNKQGYMFWDEVHPSDTMHRIISQEVYKFGQENYNLQPPNEIAKNGNLLDIGQGLLTMFKTKYEKEYENYKDQLMSGISSFFGFGSNKQNFKNINFTPNDTEEAKQSLAQLYQLSTQDKVVQHAMIDMGWLQEDGQIPKENVAPLLEQSYQVAMQQVNQNSIEKFKAFKENYRESRSVEEGSKNSMVDDNLDLRTPLSSF